MASGCASGEEPSAHALQVQLSFSNHSQTQKGPANILVPESSDAAPLPMACQRETGKAGSETLGLLGKRKQGHVDFEAQRGLGFGVRVEAKA